MEDSSQKDKESKIFFLIVIARVLQFGQFSALPKQLNVKSQRMA